MMLITIYDRLEEKINNSMVKFTGSWGINSLNIWYSVDLLEVIRQSKEVGYGNIMNSEGFTLNTQFL